MTSPQLHAASECTSQSLPGPEAPRGGGSRGGGGRGPASLSSLLLLPLCLPGPSLFLEHAKKLFPPAAFAPRVPWAWNGSLFILRLTQRCLPRKPFLTAQPKQVLCVLSPPPPGSQSRSPVLSQFSGSTSLQSLLLSLPSLTRRPGPRLLRSPGPPAAQHCAWQALSKQARCLGFSLPPAAASAEGPTPSCGERPEHLIQSPEPD